MLTKSDIKIIKDLLKNFATKDDLKSFATKDDLKLLAKQSDLLDVKQKLNDLTEFSKDAIGNILVWTDEIHRNIVKEKLSERIKKLEQIIKTS